MTKTTRALLLLATCVSCTALMAEDPKSRSFRFSYGAKISNPQGEELRIWIPIASSNTQQSVELVKLNIPVGYQIERERKYGNQILFFETSSDARSVEFSLEYRVDRHEFIGLGPEEVPATTLASRERKLFLSENRLVPIGKLPIPDLNLKDKTLSELAVAKAIYEHVDALVSYDKSKPGYGRGDVRWVCDSRTGNCTDFHSLFISLARKAGLPARFEIGFPLPVERGAGTIGGYHCWASFFTQDYGWVPVDISEADKHPELKNYYFGNLTENRISFSSGRDIDLIPKQAADPLNYFVYPHVESNGKAVERSRIELAFEFEDLDRK